MEKFPTDVIPLAEACIFYESKCAWAACFFAGKLAPPRRLCEKDWKDVIEEVDTRRWLYPSSDWKCLFAPIQAEFSLNIGLMEG